MSDNYTRDDVKKMRESCLEKAAFYVNMVRVCDCWLIVHDKLFGGIVTQKEDPGAVS